MAHSFAGLFLPHPSNNHRAHALHIEALFFYVFLFVAIHVSTHWAHQRYPDVLGYATDIRVEQLLLDTNQKRKDNGLGELSLNSQLSQAAAAKAQDMFANNYWAHNSPAGKVPWDFINASGYKYSVAGENLAKNFSNSNGVVEAWMNSSSHKENLLKPSYKDIGFAVVNGTLNGEETTLVVQMFGASSEAPVAQAPQPVVKQVEAQEPIIQAQTTPVVSLAPIRKPAPVIIPTTDVAVKNVVPVEVNPSTNVESSVLPVFTQVLTHPRIDITSLLRVLVYGFVGFLLGVLALDGWLVMRRKIVRVAGHNLAHLFFFVAFLLASTFILPGSIL